MFYEVKKWLAVYICLRKDFIYFFTTAMIVLSLLWWLFFYNLFAICIQIFYIISLKYTLFFNEDQLYKEHESEIWLWFYKKLQKYYY